MSTSGPSGQGGRFELVDGLRGLAALVVVVPHVLGLFAFPQPNGLTRFFIWLAEYGRSGVEVFFVVSGFAIAYSLRDAIYRGFSLGRFLMRRAVRLDPPYWVGLLWIGLVEGIRARVTHQPVLLPTFGKVLAHLFYLQDILGLGQFNAVFWTLCMEFQLYLVFAGIMRAMGFFPRRKSIVAAGAWADAYGWLMFAAFFPFLIVSHSALVVRGPLSPTLSSWCFPFFYLFLSGALAAWRTLGRLHDRLFQLCLVAMGLALVFKPELARIFGFLTTLLIYAAIRRDALHRWLSSSFVQWLGRISYSIYLVHVPVAILILGLRTRINVDSKLVALLCLAATYGITLALAFLLHVTIEVPCLRLSKRLRRSPMVPAPRVQEVPPT